RFAARRDLGQHLLRRGIHSLEILAAGDRLAVDEVIDSHHGGTQKWGQIPISRSAAIRFSSAPMPSIAVTTTSPGRQSTTPSAVPVRIRSPGRKVMKLEKYSIRKGTSKIMFLVFPDCVTLPLTVVLSSSAIGSATSPASTNQGPIGVAPSRFFTRRFGRYQFSR